MVDSPPGMMRPSIAGEFVRGADEFSGCAEGLQSLDVRGVCALEGEDAYGEGALHC